MGRSLDEIALDTLFRIARSHNGWRGEPIADDDIRRLYDLAATGPTAANGSPARFVFCRSKAARERLADCVTGTNAAKVSAAPVTVIIGMDLEFYEKLPHLFPHADARSWFAGNAAAIRETAFRNSTLQGAYLMLAARALGYDCGPMSGFDRTAVDAAFFAGSAVETNFLCSLGHGTTEKLFGRLPRLAFDEAASFA